MDQAEIAQILSGKLDGQSVRLRGWLHNKRLGGGIQFLTIRDGTGVIQATLKKDAVNPQVYEEIAKAPRESTVEVKGLVRADPRAPRGYELAIQEVKILNVAHEDFPVSKKYHGPDFLLDNRHLWLRSQKMQAIMKVRSKMLKYAREWFDENGYTEVHAPTFITAACEGGSTLFEVKYFDQTAYLSQSWQLYAEAMIASVGKIYTIAPSFRAERSRTRRHLTEYWHLEVELPWCDMDGIIDVSERVVTHVCNKLAEGAQGELGLLGRDPEELRLTTPFTRMTYDQAVQELRKEGVDVKWGEDITWERERTLALKHKSPFFVTHYPKAVKAFYHKPDPERPEVTLSADLLAPEGYGEIIGGGQRIDDLNELLARIKEENLNQKEYQWYVDLRKYGSVPHAGFGLGVERTLAWVCKLKHIRDAIPFPRLMNRVYP